MDSPNPFSSRTSYLDLLTRQENSFFSQGVDLGSAEVPFSSPSPDAPVLEEQTPRERRGRRKWSPTEDNVLISAWLNTSKDAVVGNQQKAGTFWKRITVYYNSSPKVAGFAPRDQTILKQRWQKINDLVGKFVGAYEAAKTQTTSGQNENDTLKLAHQIFDNDHHSGFNLEHAWKELRNDQKWRASFNTKTGGSSKRRRGDGSSPIVLEDVDEGMARPMGVKVAKAKAKKGTRESDPISAEKYESMLADRKQDLAFREKLSKHAVLDSLLAKK
uniref:Glutathione S-transferase T3 n=1 Tax=Noccaea caerulescens TaxID=107243 RepID=A0A1J3JN44_NOCCA